MTYMSIATKLKQIALQIPISRYRSQVGQILLHPVIACNATQSLFTKKSRSSGSILFTPHI